MIEISAILVSILGTLISYFTKIVIDKADEKNEDKQVEKAIKEITIENDENDNVMHLMLKNVKELREYYVISKQQARKSFSAALFICFFGICIYLLGIIAYVWFDKDISIISVISGTVVEAIAGLFFWLYKEATKQLSIYHQRLGASERYLIAYQMICEVPNEKKYEEQRNFINFVLKDNQYQLEYSTKNEK